MWLHSRQCGGISKFIVVFLFVSFAELEVVQFLEAIRHCCHQKPTILAIFDAFVPAADSRFIAGLLRRNFLLILAVAVVVLAFLRGLGFDLRHVDLMLPVEVL